MSITYFSQFERTFTNHAGATVHEYYDAETHTWIALIEGGK